MAEEITNSESTSTVVSGPIDIELHGDDGQSVPGQWLIRHEIDNYSRYIKAAELIFRGDGSQVDVLVSRIEGQTLYEVKASGHFAPQKPVAKKVAKLVSIAAKHPSTRIKPKVQFGSLVERLFLAGKNPQLEAPDNSVSTNGGDRG